MSFATAREHAGDALADAPRGARNDQEFTLETVRPSEDSRQGAHCHKAGNGILSKIR